MRPELSIRAANVHPVVARLTEVRVAWGFTVKEISKRVGVSEYTLMHMAGGTKEPGFKVLNRWASVLGYDLNLWPKQEGKA